MKRQSGLVLNVVAEATLVQNVLQTITTNLKPRVRHDTMEGRTYLVVPMVMLTEGVHAGSNGPLYYPSEELAKTPVVWNHKPIVVYHPTMNGQAITACDPTILSTRKIGVMMNTVFESDSGKLKSEAWLEADRVQAVDERILNAVEKGLPVEVSTGLFTDNEQTQGEWKGEKYSAIARNYRPDHLAILPDLKGACSIADGAGLMMNVSDATPLPMLQAALDKVLNLIRNEMSHQQVFEKLNSLIRPVGTGGIPASIDAWVVEIYDTNFIFSKGPKMFRQDYLLSGWDGVKLVGEPQEVERVVEYKAKVDGTAVGNQDKETAMDKKQVVDGLIKNASTPWEEEDREFLMGLDEARLVKMAPVVNACSPPKDMTPDEQKKWDGMDEEERKAWLDERKPAANAAPDPAPAAPKTVDEFIANAPTDMQDVLREGVAAHKAMKEKLIASITANKANTFSVEQLQAKSIAELRALVALATAKPTANFAGAADGASPATNAEEPLMAPAMDFAN